MSVQGGFYTFDHVIFIKNLYSVNLGMDLVLRGRVYKEIIGILHLETATYVHVIICSGHNSMNLVEIL